MSDKHGDFIWYELLTTDPDAAQGFYADLLGWGYADSGMPDTDYRIGSVGDTPVVGLFALTSEMQENGARPMWAGYVGVDDVDSTASAVRVAGGAVLLEPTDIPGIGRFAYVNDPQGVPFFVMKGDGAGSDSYAKHEPKEGHCAWNELSTTDPDAAKRFYGELFGWQKGDEMDMGEAGLYEMWRQDDYLLGGVMKKPEQSPVPYWLFYFRVPDIDTAARTVGERGGSILNGPMEIPGGEFVLQGLDPQGALFAVIGKRRAA